MGKDKSKTAANVEVKEEIEDADETTAADESQTSQTATAAHAITYDKEEYEALCQMVNPIAQPMASRKLAKKVYKLVRKSAKEKSFLRHGLSDVMKALRKKEVGIVILAGNVSPIDVYSHVPAMCEEKGLPYVFTPSREHLGLCAGYKRPAILLMVKKHESYEDLYEQVAESANSLVVEPIVVAE